MDLAHYTLNTGHLRMSPRAEVLETTIRLLDRFVLAGRGWVPGMDRSGALGFRIVADSAEPRWMFLLAFREPQKEPVTFATCVLAASEEAALHGWQSLCRIAATEGTPIVDECPDSTPVLLVQIRAAAALINPEILMAAADLERCLAWTILIQAGLAS